MPGKKCCSAEPHYTYKVIQKEKLWLLCELKILMKNINQKKVKEWKYIMKRKYLTKHFRSKPTWLSFGQMLRDNVPDKVKNHSWHRHKYSGQLMSVQKNDGFKKWEILFTHYSNLYFKMYVLQMYCLAQKLENVIFNWCIIAEPGFWALVCVIINTRKGRVIQNPNHKNTAIVFCTV